jgi:hypothetical protein
MHISSNNQICGRNPIFVACSPEFAAVTTFTKLKTRTVSSSCLFVALVFGSGAVYLLSKHTLHTAFFWWRFGLLIGLAILSSGFPFTWLLAPNKHPVRRALAVHGDAQKVAAQLDVEMSREHEVQGPFHFTPTFLVYSPSHTLDVVPHEDVESALNEIDHSAEGPPTPKIFVTTRGAKTYTWYRTWLQGTFDADRVLTSIRNRANLTRKIGAVYYKPSVKDYPNA